MANKSTKVIQQEVDKLKEMVKTGEILKYSERDLEEHIDLTRKTLRKHLNIIKQEIGSRDIKVITLRLIDILEEIMGDIEKYWRKARREGDEQKMMYYGEKMFKALEKFTDFLERFGIKPKIADKVEIQSTNINIDILAESEKILKRIEDGT